MMISDDGNPMYFVPNAKIDEKDLRLITADDIKKIELSKKLKEDLSFCNLVFESLVGLYCDKDGNVIQKIGDEFYMFKLKIKDMKNKRVDSCSDIQQKIEKNLFEKLKTKLKISDFESNKKLSFNNKNVYIVPDFYSEKEKIIGEIHSHLGKLKGAQPDKIASDILKMISFEKDQNIKLRKMIVVCDEEEEKQLKGNSFLAEAIRLFDIEIHKFNLNDNEKNSLE